MKQEMTGGSGISWTIYISFAPHSEQILPPNQQHQSTEEIATDKAEKQNKGISL